MKILVIGESDSYGGAARATYRLHQSLLQAGFDSTLLVQQKKRLDGLRVNGPQGLVKKAIATINPYLDQIPLSIVRQDENIFFSTGLLSISLLNGLIKRIQPDVIHLNWVCKGAISINDLGNLDAPIVWTLHDSWPFTGGCHTITNCDKYLSKCGCCPALNSSIDNDLSAFLFRKKSHAYRKIKKLTIVGVSQWISELARNSSLLGKRKVVTIPNTIDIETYKPISKNWAKDVLNVDVQRKVVLFGGMSALEDKNKGFQELIVALTQLSLACSDILLIVFGSAKPENKLSVPFDVQYLGQLHDDISLNIAYCAADVVVVPSKQESFGQTASEAMSCGTPVVAFATSGLLDIVDHKINGYLATPNDISDLAYGIEWVLQNPNYEAISLASRDKVVKEFSYEVVANKYISLYEKLLGSE
jgi:glycosyltransferase involved in cell wall biosynthesis